MSNRTDDFGPVTPAQKKQHGADMASQGMYTAAENLMNNGGREELLEFMQWAARELAKRGNIRIVE